MSTQDTDTTSRQFRTPPTLAALRPDSVPSDPGVLQNMTRSKHEAIVSGIQVLQDDAAYSGIQSDLQQEDIDVSRLSDALWSTDNASSEYQTGVPDKLKAIRDQYNSTVSDTTHYSTASGPTTQMYLAGAIEYLDWFQRSLDARRSHGITRPEGRS